MDTLSKSDRLLLLELALKWSDCERVSEWLELIRLSFGRLLSTHVEINIERRSIYTDSIKSGKTPPQTTTYKPTTDKHPAQFVIVINSSSNVRLEIAIISPNSDFSSRDLEALAEASVHIASTHEQLSRIESLTTALSKLELERHGKSEYNSGLPLHSLTKRERECVDLLGKGHTNSEIALQMEISRRTVEKHLEVTYRKLGLENRYQLIREVAR